MSTPTPSLVIILAAGEGTRMKSATPKVLHEVLGIPLLGHVLRAVSGLGPEHVLVVVGHQRLRVQGYLAEAAPGARTAVQETQNGTGHAVRCALAELAAQAVQPGSGPVVVVAADTPLLGTETLASMVAEHVDTGAAATVLSAVAEDPAGYGRIVRAVDGSVLGIVEHKDASAEELAIAEINSGMYCFDAGSLSSALGQLSTDNSQGEEYLTDVLGILRSEGKRVSACIAADPDEIHGINDRVQLAQAGRLMADRINTALMKSGVTILDPATTWIGPDVAVGRDAVIERNCSLLAGSTVGEAALIGPDTTLIDCDVAAGARVVRSHCESAQIGPDATVGPFTYLRPGSRLRAGAKAGAYVEIKNSIVGEGSKVPHLSYVGDAEIGSGSNIGAATVFVNYDGVAKHRTMVGDDVRVGSDSMLVAPVTIGDGAYTAAGSVITEDVPAGALALGRARQRNIDGWVGRRRPDTASARSAAGAGADAGSQGQEAAPADSAD
ncbi:MAG TPA: bifunctional UDP-N-acetylglucosamine diphosphorylase/glucosamine-1-phosphate N-acetyltransferase GlmU [Actinomycetota bacterium]|nr:bifunctional UDP-N-acetylglucosamine diphosphorylase/glucosamine-1-phosphate N-acetyltransferase GlmU [Actinomycetota bacterium]